MAATGTVHHGINTFAIGGSAVTNVVSVQWSRVGAGAGGVIDGAGNKAHFVTAPVAVRGTITINSLAEAEKVAGSVAASTNVTYNTKNDLDVDKAVVITNIKTSGVLGGQNSLGMAGPYVVQFVADSVGAPAA